MDLERAGRGGSSGRAPGCPRKAAAMSPSKAAALNSLALSALCSGIAGIAPGANGRGRASGRAAWPVGECAADPPSGICRERGAESTDDLERREAFDEDLTTRDKFSSGTK